MEGGMVDELTCSCCADLLVEPTTLECGHTVCRLCLAHWYMNGRRECPECRQKWHTDLVGKVNYTLRSTIEKLYPDKLRERIANLASDPANAATLKNFDEALKRPTVDEQYTELREPVNLQRWLQFRRVLDRNAQERPIHRVQAAVGAQNNQGKVNFLVGLFVILGCLLVLAILIAVFTGWLTEGSRDLISKPVTRWNEQEVIRWTETLGPWARDNLTPMFESNRIDGQLLLDLNEEDFLWLENSKEENLELTELQWKMFYSSLRSLRLTLHKAPQTLWEFKDLHICMLLFFIFFYSSHPRVILLVVCLTHYEQFFMPFVHATFPVVEGIADVCLYTYKFPPLSFVQIVDVTLQGLLLPYYLLGQFIWARLLTTHWILAPLQLINCAILTVTEVHKLSKLYRSEIKYRALSDLLKSQLKELLIFKTGICLTVCYYVFPSFIFNLCFYIILADAVTKPVWSIPWPPARLLQ